MQNHAGHLALQRRDPAPLWRHRNRALCRQIVNAFFSREGHPEPTHKPNSYSQACLTVRLAGSALVPGAGMDHWPTRSQTEREPLPVVTLLTRRSAHLAHSAAYGGETEAAAKDKGPGLEAPEPPTPTCGLLGGRRVRKPPSAHPHPTSSPTSPPIPLCPVGRSTHIWGFKKFI